MFVGLDVHKKYCYASVIDEEGQLVSEGRFLNQLEELDSFLLKLEPGSEVVLEATAIWEQLYDRMEEQGFEVTLAHPLKVRAIASAKVKTDRIDSQTLAQLLRANLIPSSYVPQLPMRTLRKEVRHRATLVRWRTQVKNNIHLLLARQGLQFSKTDLFGKAGMAFLHSLMLEEDMQSVLEDYLAILQILNERITLTTKHLQQKSKTIPQVELLTSIPGIGTYSALLLLAEIGDIGRFSNSKQLCSYAGLVPRVHQSGMTEYYGRITKEGSRWMRWILVQAVHQTVRRPNVIQRFYKKLAHKKGTKVALVASARKLLCYIYQMLKQEVRFEELKVVQAQGPPAFATGH